MSFNDTPGPPLPNIGNMPEPPAALRRKLGFLTDEERQAEEQRRRAASPFDTSNMVAQGPSPYGVQPQLQFPGPPPAPNFSPPGGFVGSTGQPLAANDPAVESHNRALNIAAAQMEGRFVQSSPPRDAKQEAFDRSMVAWQNDGAGDPSPFPPMPRVEADGPPLPPAPFGKMPSGPAPPMPKPFVGGAEPPLPSGPLSAASGGQAGPPLPAAPAQPISGPPPVERPFVGGKDPPLPPMSPLGSVAMGDVKGVNDYLDRKFAATRPGISPQEMRLAAGPPGVAVMRGNRSPTYAVPDPAGNGGPWVEMARPYDAAQAAYNRDLMAKGDTRAATAASMEHLNPLLHAMTEGAKAKSSVPNMVAGLMAQNAAAAGRPLTGDEISNMIDTVAAAEKVYATDRGVPGLSGLTGQAGAANGSSAEERLRKNLADQAEHLSQPEIDAILTAGGIKPTESGTPAKVNWDSLAQVIAERPRAQTPGNAGRLAAAIRRMGLPGGEEPFMDAAQKAFITNLNQSQNPWESRQGPMKLGNFSVEDTGPPVTEPWGSGDKGYTIHHPALEKWFPDRFAGSAVAPLASWSGSGAFTEEGRQKAAGKAKALGTLLEALLNPPPKAKSP